MANHQLKIWPEFFEAVRMGMKLHEIRKNDRDFHALDTLELCEWDPAMRMYTGRTVEVLVTHITFGGRADINFGWELAPDLVVMSIRRTGDSFVPLLEAARELVYDIRTGGSNWGDEADDLITRIDGLLGPRTEMCFCGHEIEEPPRREIERYATVEAALRDKEHLEGLLRERIARLETERDELKGWQERHDLFPGVSDTLRVQLLEACAERDSWYEKFLGVVALSKEAVDDAERRKQGLYGGMDKLQQMCDLRKAERDEALQRITRLEAELREIRDLKPDPEMNHHQGDGNASRISPNPTP